MKKYISIFFVGIAIFSMFFGGGNLVFPLLLGSKTSSPFFSTLGFILSSVLLPFYGVIIGLFFKGNYEKFLTVWGKAVGYLLIFSLLFFWIPFGSGPRCNQLAYGAFCEIGGEMPLWLYSALYSILVYALTFKKNRFLEILGKVVTPLLIFFLFFLILFIFKQDTSKPYLGEFSYSEMYTSISFGYNTMDFIAAIFFSSTIVALLKEKQKEKFDINFVRNAFIIAVALLSLVYVGMIYVGYVKSDSLASVSGAQLLTALGHAMFGEEFKLVTFMIVTLSVLSTSMALAFVFSDYLKTVIFKDKVSHKICLFISVFISFVMSTIGFERLSILISYAMSYLYPFLLLTTTVAFGKKLLEARAQKLKGEVEF